MKKKKTFVLTVSKVFMKGHPLAGHPTNFKGQILSGRKIHTIRAGDYWKKVADQVNAGEAVLSVREWSGQPYNSKQVEIKQFEKFGLQEIKITGYLITVDTQMILFSQLSENDGLSLLNFSNWFKIPCNFSGHILHFTDFRY